MFFFASSEEKKTRQDAKNHLEICLRSFEQKNQDKYKKSMQFISKHVQNNNQDIIEIVVDSIKATIKDEEQLPVRKYQAMRLLRDLMKIQIKNKNKALGKYVLKKIFKRLTVLASHNAGSNQEDKGRDIFKNVKRDQEKYSINFLNELLLAIEEWAKTWPGVSDGMKKQFNEAYKELLTNGVKFPKENLKLPQPQGYRGDETNRNSQSPYNSLPKRQSIVKNEQRSSSQVRGSSEEKQVKKSTSAITVSSGKLDEKKVKQYFNNIMPSIEQFLLIVNQMETPDDPQNLSFLNDMIEQLRNVISQGDSFCTQLSQEEMKSDPMGRIVLSALNYSEGASKDLKKLLKNVSQFSRFKTKYLKLGNELMQSIKNALNPSKQQRSSIVQKPKVTQKVQTSVPKVTQVKKIAEPSSKKLLVPRVSTQNLYNSSSGPGNNWVIKERSQYNSNSYRDEGEVHQKFGSFGIGGIGQKVRNQSSKEKQKSGFANKSSTERPPQKYVEAEITPEENQKPKTLKEIGSKSQVTQKPQKQNNKENTFESFKVSDESSPQQFEHEIKKKPKKVEQVKDEFNDSGFKEQQKVELSKEQKTPHLDESSANFFGDFDQANPNLQQLCANRNQRRQKINVTTRQINISQQNPFENPFDSKIGNESNNFSAFNNEKPSAFGNQSQEFNEKSTSVINRSEQPKRKQSINDPFQNSFELNKSALSKNQRNSFDDKNPNFWEGQAEKSNSDNVSQRNRSQIQNPFQTQEFERRNEKSVNPFEDDNKSELSQKNRSSVLNFEMNKSFTKSDRQNPFQNPFETTSNNLSRTNEQPTNPFEQTSKDDFKPKPTQTFQSVSQQGSFKRVDIKQAKIIKNTEMENPFEAMTEHKSIDEARNQQKMNDSFKFSVKGHDQNDGFDFDQFQNISKAQRDSINTSSFANPKVKTEPNDFAHSGVFGNKRNSVERTVSVEKERSIHFSQFGEVGEDTNRSKEFEKKENSKKSINFSEFGDFNEKKPTSKNDFEAFSGFKDIQVKQKNNFDAFEVSKRSKNDFFRQTQKSQLDEKSEDAKSRHSGFSGFNMNADNKSDHKDKSSVDWNDFENFEKGRETDKVKFDDDEFRGFGSEMKLSKQSKEMINTGRSQEDEKTQKNFYDKNDLKLQFSEDNSKYQSPEFNQKYDSTSLNQHSHKDIMSSMRQVEEGKKEEHRPSIQFEEFAPVEKKGYEWNPLGIRVEKGYSKIFSCTDNELQAKKRQLEQQKLIYEGQKQLIQKVKQLYNQARKIYLEKVAKIDVILKQKQSYKKILVSLSQANHNKESEIFSLNEKIKKVSALKEKILEKEKLFFEKTKTHKEIEAAGTNYRPKHNKWEIFNRNLKMMRQREMEGESNKYQTINNYSRTGYANSRYF